MTLEIKRKKRFERKGESGRRDKFCWQKKDGVFCLQYERQFGLFSFLFLLLAWAFEPYFILYTLPGCQAQAEVNEPDLGCLVRPASSSACSGQTLLGWDKVREQGGSRGRTGCSKMRKESKQASQ